MNSSRFVFGCTNSEEPGRHPVHSHLAAAAASAWFSPQHKEVTLSVRWWSHDHQKKNLITNATIPYRNETERWHSSLSPHTSNLDCVPLQELFFAPKCYGSCSQCQGHPRCLYFRFCINKSLNSAKGKCEDESPCTRAWEWPWGAQQNPKNVPITEINSYTPEIPSWWLVLFFVHSTLVCVNNNRKKSEQGWNAKDVFVN